MRTVLFLDIDGVCHPADACGPMPDGTVFGEDLFRWTGPLLQMLEALPHVDVVLHSSWRNAYGGDLSRLLADLPPAMAARVIGVTPSNVAGRQASIEAYVKRHRLQHFVAVDDQPFYFQACRGSGRAGGPVKRSDRPGATTPAWRRIEPKGD